LLASRPDPDESELDDEDDEPPGEFLPLLLEEDDDPPLRPSPLFSALEMLWLPLLLLLLPEEPEPLSDDELLVFDELDEELLDEEEDFEPPDELELLFLLSDLSDDEPLSSFPMAVLYTVTVNVPSSAVTANPPAHISPGCTHVSTPPFENTSPGFNPSPDVGKLSGAR